MSESPLGDTSGVEPVPVAEDLEEEPEEGVDVEFDGDEEVEPDDSADPGAGGNEGTEDGEEDE